MLHIYFLHKKNQTNIHNGVYFSLYDASKYHYILYLFFDTFFILNISLAVFNLLPIPPLDGSRILFVVLPDKVYFGINLGMNSMTYSYEEYFKEQAVNSEDFLVELKDAQGNIISSSYFNRMKYRNAYSLSGNGYFAKFGIIANPVRGLRIGAALQTPTRMEINETWEDEGQTDFTGPDGKSWSALSPYGENMWVFTSPLKANFGVAYTLGQFGTISTDYELTNYGNIKYRSSAYTDRNTLEYINDDIRHAYGVVHNLRAGIEIKPFAALALRAGYDMKTSAQKERLTHKAAIGVGYSSKGSFFADAALTRTFLPREYFMPYDDYVYTESGQIDPNYYAPELLIKSAVWKVVFTFGFRF